MPPSNIREKLRRSVQTNDLTQVNLYSNKLVYYHQRHSNIVDQMNNQSLQAVCWHDELPQQQITAGPTCAVSNIGTHKKTLSRTNLLE